MRLFKQCVIKGVEYPLVYEDLRLDYNRAGRGIVQVCRPESDTDRGPDRGKDGDEELTADKLLGDVQFSLGWNFCDTMTRFFSGDVERAVRVDNKQWRLFVREGTARLDAPHPIALRHPTLKDVLAAYAARTRLEFIVPEADYASRKVPAFDSLGSGFQGLTSIGAVFGIEDYHWQAQGNGKVFVGSWAHSFWADKPVTMPEEVFTGHTAGDTCTIAALPWARPGMLLNGRRVRAVHFSGQQSTIEYCRA